MADLLGIGSSGIGVAQQALSTVSNNIANLSTDGYSRQTTEIRQAQPKDVGNGYIGTGAYFDGVARQYDSFLESSLQQATSDLESQGAAVEYANRLLDLLGDEKIGLTTALNKFFSSGKSLSTDPASPALRGVMLRESEALASRFNGLAGQLGDLGDQSLSALEADVRSVNSLAEQIAEVNRQMLKKSSERDQAPELLDRRDQLLRDLSEYVQIRTSFDKRGSVTVSLSESSTKGRIVSGIKSSSLAIDPVANDRARLEYKLQGELSNEPLTGLPSGSIAGYARFYSETLVKVTGELDTLADVLIDEVNAIQTTGLDGEGNLGQEYFQAVPSFDVDRGASSGDYEVQVIVNNPEDFQASQVTVLYDGSRGLWYSTGSDGNTIFSNQQGLLQLDDLTIQVTGNVNVGDQFTLTPDTGAAQGIRLALDDGIKIATSSLFRITPSATNSGTFDPKASFSGVELPSGSRFDVEELQTGRPITVNSSEVTPVTVIPAGKLSVDLLFDPETGSDNALQIMTTDGRHLIGSGALGSLESMVNSLPQFQANATYSDTYLNQSGMLGYKDFDLLYGARAEAVEVTDLLPLHSLFFEAPFGTDFGGGGLDFTLEPATTFDRLGVTNSAFADPALGTVTAVNNTLFLGQGDSVVELATLETNYNGLAQTLRVRFSDTLASGTVSDELAARVSELITFNNGSDLTDVRNVVAKRITTELFTSDLSTNLALSRDFVSSDLIDEGRVASGDRRFMAKLITRGIGYAAGTDRVVIDDGDVSINGISLGALTVGSSGVLSADDVKAWIDLADSGANIQAHNVIEIPSEGLRLEAGAGLQINGQSIPSLSTESLTRFTSDDDLLASINALTEETGVFAQKLNSGNFILRNNNLGGANIVIGGSSSGLGGNALGIASKSYIGNISMALESEDGGPISLDLGASGKPSDLNLLGLDTQIRLSGEIDEDLLVFVTGSGQSQVTAVTVDSGVTVADGLRSRQVEFEFVASDRYRVRDMRTDTVLAERSYNGELALQYQGIQVALDNPAKVGDSFVIDGNNLGPDGSFDAQGNNVNILRLVDLESKGVLDGGLTLTEGYLSFVGDVGNLATQSLIARDALEIVQSQAVEARDRVSGVNLDKEAADLIRFQQAYQASAQVMQVATRLFDTMLQIR